MKMTNSEIAERFRQLAELLESQGGNPYRVRAYRNAAYSIARMSRSLHTMVKNGMDLTSIPGIGNAIAFKIKALVTTGEMPHLPIKQQNLPKISRDLLQIPGLGPKRVKILFQKLNIRSVNDLKRALAQNKLEKLPGFGQKTQQHILSNIDKVKKNKRYLRLGQVIATAQAMKNFLKKSPFIQQIEIAGSYRRHKEIIRDLDIVVTSNNPTAAIKHFLQFMEIYLVYIQKQKQAAIRLFSGLEINLFIVPSLSYGAALIHFTGSREHINKLQQLAIKKQLTLTEHGVFKGKKCLAAKTEKEVYQELDLPFIAAELRENRGEIIAARQGKLPNLVTLKDIRGDLHAHTYATDGRHSIEEMAEAAALKGYEYLAITDHTKHLAITHGLNEQQLLNQIKLIDKLNAKLKNIVILKSTECDILEDGSLDLSNDVLKECDLVVCSLHSKFKLPGKKQTERMLRAMDNPYFNIWAHPTGRLINSRKPYDINLERIMRAAKDRGISLEINSQPARLDLADVYCKMAKEIGIKLAISTDAHSIRELNFMEYGIFQARRGWLEPNDIINTLKLVELKKQLRRK